MNLELLLALAPLIVLAFTAALIMAQIAVRRHHATALLFCLIGLAAALACLPAVGRRVPLGVTPLLVIDAQGLFYIGLIILSAAVTALFAYDYLRRLGGHSEEFYLLLLLAVLGAAVLVTSRHFAAFFIGLEILSIALYALIAYPRHRRQSLEAGLKYLVLAAVSAAFLLLGMALIYWQTGTLAFAGMTSRLTALPGTGAGAVVPAAAALLVVGMGFKLALVPFHMWTPDVYQGAPAPVAGLVATVSKAGMAGLLVRLFVPIDLLNNQSLYWTFALVAFASMVGGNLLALGQSKVKRLLAYSSIAHMGYLLTAFLAGGSMAGQAVAFYMTAYAVTTLGAFGIIGMLSHSNADADHLEDFQGLAHDHPWLAGLFAAMLLSLAGIPLTVGFIGKFFLVTAGLRGDLGWLVITLLVTSGISLFYYLRVVVALFSGQGRGRTDIRPHRAVAFSSGLALAAVVLLVFWLGIYPQVLLSLVRIITP